MLYAVTVATSSLLLFLIQPMLAKAILPHYGGSAGVWVTCMLFFQVALLAGYLYSYWISRQPPRLQVTIHLCLLSLSLWALPVRPRFELASSANPSVSILWLLTASVGLPYFLLSTTSPLVQSWRAARGAQFPYRLFALSNAASLAALFAYPVAIEPLFSGKHQLAAWSAAYLVFAVLAAVSAIRAAAPAIAAPNEKLIGAQKRPLLWIALSACASTLWLAVANHLSQQVAPIPFLWVLPLGLYLLSFVLCFEGRNRYRASLFRWLLPAAWLAFGVRIALQGSVGGIEWEIPILSAALFICCVFCHGELAELKPDPRDGLAFFYLMVALGGALGAVFVGLIAPNVFSAYLELPIGVTGCVLLALYLIFEFPPKRLARLAVFAALAFIFALRYRSGDAGVVALRNFYGAIEVRDRPNASGAPRALYNGATLHGIEFLLSGRSREATTFYSPESGIGRLLDSLHQPAREVAIVGLGAGTLATYGRAGDHFRFYDINPAVILVAQRYFQFLSESKARVDVVLDDGRLALEQQPLHSLDVIVLDAFSDDSIPIHLITREAIEIDLARLRPQGVIAIHITNRYLDLAPIVEALARSLRLKCLVIDNLADPDRGISEASWAVLSEDVQTDILSSARPSTQSGRDMRPWTDDYSNLFRALR